jgi:hypothetical protein
MTPVALGAQPSGSPLPVSKVARHPCVAAGGVAFPGAENFLILDPTSGGSGWETYWQAQLGPFNLPYRYWLCVGYNNIFANVSGTGWIRFDIQIKLLVNNTAYGPDINGQTFHQDADSMEYLNNWEGHSIEAKFFCEANTVYHARVLSRNSPSGVQYYQHPTHSNMWAYTVGEGVY